MSAEEIYQASLKFDNNNMEKVCSELSEYKYSFLVDALIIANITLEANTNTLLLIADMAGMMGCDKEDLGVIGQVAKSKLLDKFELLKDVSSFSKERLRGKFQEYSISKDWITAQRVCCGNICVNKYGKIADLAILNKEQCIENMPGVCHPSIVREQLQTGSIVKKGEVLLTYYEIVSDIGTKHGIKLLEKVIRAPMDGIIFLMDVFRKGLSSKYKDKYLEVYVVSFFDDYDTFLKWHKENKK